MGLVLTIGRLIRENMRYFPTREFSATKLTFSTDRIDIYGSQSAVLYYRYKKKITKIYQDFGSRLINRSPYTWSIRYFPNRKFSATKLTFSTHWIFSHQIDIFSVTRLLARIGIFFNHWTYCHHFFFTYRKFKPPNWHCLESRSFKIWNQLDEFNVYL